MNINSDWKDMTRAGGISFIVSGVIFYLFIISVFAFQVQLPLEAEYVLNNPVMPTVLFSLAAIGEFLLMPGILALYFYLRDSNRTRMFLGTSTALAAIPMFLISRGQTISLIAISSSYTGASDDAVRAAYLASAQLGLEVANVYAIMSLVLLGVGSVIIGLVMLKSALGRRIGYLVVLAGCLMVMGTFGVLFEPLTIGTLFGLILTGLWQLVVGLKLSRT